MSRCVCKFQQKDRNSQIPLQQVRTQSNQDDCRGEEVYLEEIVTASLQDGGHFHDSAFDERVAIQPRRRAMFEPGGENMNKLEVAGDA